MEQAVDPGYVGVRYAKGSRAARHGHVESYFLKANDPHKRRALWLKTTIYATRRAPQRAVAEAWAIAFDADGQHVAVKSSVPFEAARFSPTSLDVEVDGVTLRAGDTHGLVESGGRSISWALRLASDGVPLVHFPAHWMYNAPFPSSKLVSPFPDLRVSGDVVVNGQTWHLDGWHGLLGHNWGPRHAPLYAWGHCNQWDVDPATAEGREGRDNQADELVLEGVSARVKLGPFLSPLTTLVCLRYRGVRYELNAARDLLTNRAEVTPRRWTFAGHNALLRLNGEMWGETDDFVGLFYVNPDGAMTHCLNTKLARARVEITLQGRAPFVVTSRAAALEIGTLDPHHGVRMYV